MRFELLQDSEFKLWDEMCLKSDDAWIYHTSKMLEFHLAYRPELESQNLSFFIYDNNGDPIGICPLFLEKNKYQENETREFSYGGLALPPPALINGLNNRTRDEVFKEIYAKIDSLAIEQNVARCSIRLCPLAKNIEFNSLLKFGYLETSINTQVIDCREPTDSLLRQMRKGHIADIKRASKSIEFIVFDSANIDSKIFSSYQALHAKAAGRVTRPQSTFDKMFEMITTGESILVGALKDKRFIGFALLETFKKQACYSSAANDPEYRELPISHGIQWASLEWLCRNGYSLYEVGWQHFGPQLHDLTSPKDQSISQFKRGFGGRTIPTFVGEKYFNSKFCKDVLNDRVEKYLGSIFLP